MQNNKYNKKPFKKTFLSFSDMPVALFFNSHNFEVERQFARRYPVTALKSKCL
jgi:hypothetical protein